MIQYGDQTKIPQLKKLWKVCFADEDAYIDDFFTAMYQNEHVLLEEENGVLMGASFFLPGEIWLEQPETAGSWQPVRYVYALAVYPQYRGKGIAARLLQTARRLYDAPLIAEPAEEGLIQGFYEPHGFVKNFYLKKHAVEIPHYDVKAAQTDSWQWTPVNAAQYRRIRDAHFQKHGYISWPQRHIAFAIQQHSNNGGGALLLTASDRKELMLYLIETQGQEKKLIITETTLSESEARHILIPHITGICSSLVCTGPSDDVCEDRLTGMSAGLPAIYGYINLTLD